MVSNLQKSIILFLFITFLLSVFFYNKESFKQVYFKLNKIYLSYKFSKCYKNYELSNKGQNFIIAGHTYGHPSDKNKSTYPKFLSHLMKEEIKGEKIILAGDIVKEASLENFSNVKKELELFFKKIYVSPGNHDVKSKLIDKKDFFLKIFSKSFDHFVYKNNLFLILDTTINPGSLSRDQLDFIKNKFQDNVKYNHIFVITHHVIWQDYIKQNVQSAVEKDFFKNNNFLELKKMISKSNDFNKVIFIAGDVSVTNQTTKLFCERNENFYYIMTGMGNKNFDNFLKITISEKGKLINIKPVFF